jgi:hypothetical protein
LVKEVGESQSEVAIIVAEAFTAGVLLMPAVRLFLSILQSARLAC